jgi:hypothetical protein
VRCLRHVDDCHRRRPTLPAALWAGSAGSHLGKKFAQQAIQHADPTLDVVDVADEGSAAIYERGIR